MMLVAEDDANEGVARQAPNGNGCEGDDRGDAVVACGLAAAVAQGRSGDREAREGR
jgi:hypothetical protein